MLGRPVQHALRLAIVALVGCADEPVPSSASGTGGSGGAAGVGGVASECDALCDATIALGCEDATCAPDCAEAHGSAGACQLPLQSYIECLASHASEIESCTEYPLSCELEHDAFFACGSAEGCGVVECPAAEDGSCTCQAFCGGAKYLERCQQTAEGLDCQCEVDGTVMRSCPSSRNACAFFVGCCAPFLS